MTDHEIDFVRIGIIADATVIPEEGLAEQLGDSGPECLDLYLRQIDRDAPLPTGKFVQAIRSKQRHMVGRGFEQIGLLQKHPDSYVLGIMRLVRGILIGGLHLRKQVDPLAIRLRQDDFESPGVAQFCDAVQIGAQTFGVSILRTSQKRLQRCAGIPLVLIQQIERKAFELAVMAEQQCLHQGHVDCLDEPGFTNFCKLPATPNLPARQ